MTTAEIEAFLAICEAQSVSKAAERLFISQSSLSTKIKTLEKELGCTLLVRGKGQRTLSLTEAGQRFYELARQYQTLLRRMYAVGSDMALQRLRVSSMNSVGTYLMTPTYERFIQQNGDVVLEVQEMPTAVVCDSLVRGGTELAFSASTESRRGALYDMAFWEPMMLVCARTEDYADGVGLKELDPKREVFTGWFEEFEKWHQAAFGPAAVPFVRVEMVSQMLHFLRKSRGWAIAPASVARGLAADGDMECHTLGFEAPRRATYCLYTEDSIRRSAAGRFLRCLWEVLLELQAQGYPMEICGDFFEKYAKES